MLPYRITQLEEKKLIGQSIDMSYVNNLTGQLWKNFMPRRMEIGNAISTDLFSLQVYPSDFFKEFNVQKSFRKYALLEVDSLENIPDGMEPFVLEAGKYLVIDYKGDGSDYPKQFQYILSELLPSLQYRLDERPHFERLGNKYKNNDPNSEEEIWIPIR